MQIKMHIFQILISLILTFLLLHTVSSLTMSLSSVSTEKSHPRWSERWNAGIKPGETFDKASSSPYLLKLINEDKDIPDEGHFLIPGCGRGYDILSFNNNKRHVLGIDSVDVAVESCKKYLLENNIDVNTNTLIDVKQMNFFDLNENSFDFIYDYTFLCALDPSIRTLWAEQMYKILKPGGELLTLIFPIGMHETGPPFAVSLELYQQLLLPLGFVEKDLYTLSPELCHPGRAGKEGDTGNSGVGRWIKK